MPNPRDLYREGEHYRVVKEGARLEGLIWFGDSTWSGYSRVLPVGSVVKCTGWKPNYGSLVDAVNFTDHKVPEGARWMQIWPMAGLFSPWPMPGYLQEMSQDEAIEHFVEKRRRVTR